MLDLLIGQIAEADVKFSIIDRMKTAGLVLYRQAGIENDLPTTRLLQLFHCILMRPRFTENLAIKIGTLIGTDDQCLWMVDRNGSGFCVGEALDIGYRILTVMSAFIDVRGYRFER